MFYRLNGLPEIDAVLMSSHSREKRREMCLCIWVCLGICVRVYAPRPVSAAARVCDSNGFKWGIQACKWSHLNLGPFPTYLQGFYSVFRAPFWHNSYGDKTQWGSGLEWYTIDYKESSGFALYNLWSSEISTTNLQQAPSWCRHWTSRTAQREH